MGGKQGTFDIGLLSSDPKVLVCGLEAKILSKDNNQYTYETPTFLS